MSKPHPDFWLWHSYVVIWASNNGESERIVMNENQYRIAFRHLVRKRPLHFLFLGEISIDGAVKIANIPFEIETDKARA